jgi:cobalt-zinc-cadmium efflux system outer membrane protein
MAPAIAALTLVSFAGALPVTTAVAQDRTASTGARPTRGISRDEALQLALQHSPRGALARADSAAALALMSLARQWENPALSASYSKSAPQAHFSLDVPFDWRNGRAPRIAAAASGLEASALRATYGRAVLALDIDTAYTRAEAVAAHATLSARTRRDADSLLTIARLRRDAGDASDLDVELARVFAGQMQNIAINDSLAAIGSRIALQVLVGVSADSVELVPTEALVLSDSSATFSAPPPMIARVAMPSSSLLPVAVAEREAETARQRVLVEQRRRLVLPSLSVGFESSNPGGDSGLLPTIGLALPLPLFHRNTASIQVAQAELARTRALLALVRLEQSAALAGATREAAAARGRSSRSAQLVASANRISALSLIAYREGASPLSTALEAQRSARESLAQFVDDVAAARLADSVLHFFSLSTVAVPR